MNIIANALIWLSGVMIGISVGSMSVDETKIITAITDNGCSSHQELKPTKTRIENYNLTNL